MSAQEINIIEIMDMIPHRYPLLLVDRVMEYKVGQYIIGKKNVTANEPQFTGHFPQRPVMPGVLMVEALAQISAVLVAKSMDDTSDKEVFFMSIENAKFRKIVEPGDTLMMKSTILQNRGPVWKFKAEATVDDKIAAETVITAMVKDKNK